MLTDASFEVSYDHPVFEGHFPGHPLVPGVLLLGWLTEILRVQGQRLLGLPTVKFIAPLRPVDEHPLGVLVHFIPSRKMGQWSFNLVSSTNNALIVSGSFLLNLSYGGDV